MEKDHRKRDRRNLQRHAEFPVHERTTNVKRKTLEAPEEWHTRFWRWGDDGSLSFRSFLVTASGCPACSSAFSSSLAEPPLPREHCPLAEKYRHFLQVPPVKLLRTIPHRRARVFKVGVEGPGR